MTGLLVCLDNHEEMIIDLIQRIINKYDDIDNQNRNMNKYNDINNNNKLIDTLI